MSVLVVTAHPDDESMFFSPTILNLIRCRKRVHILCLSSGDSLNQGKIRKSELYHSCSILGVPRSNVMLIEDIRLRDGPHSVWSAEVVADHVSRAIDSVCPDKVITFDCHGISGHINHIHTFRGTYLAARKKCPADGILLLETSRLLVKFMGIFAVFIIMPYCLLDRRNSFIPNLNLRKTWRAMVAHQSQLVWYRILFILLAHYSYINVLQVSSPIVG